VITGRWAKSSHSNSFSNCVEVASLPDGVAVRDSKDPDGPVLTFTRSEWESFLQAVKSGALEAPSPLRLPPDRLGRAGGPWTAAGAPPGGKTAPNPGCSRRHC
jgi:hypothetical protein